MEGEAVARHESLADERKGLWRDDRPWSRSRCKSLGFQQCFNIGRERAAARWLEACFDLAREAFEQGCTLLDAFALKPSRDTVQHREFVGERLAENAAQPVRQSPSLRALALDLLKLRKNLRHGIAHPLSGAPTNSKFCHNLVKADAEGLGSEQLR
jgi:hypothetical protein